MQGSAELDSLKSAQESAFKRKQAAYKRYKSLQASVNAAYDTMQKTWDKRHRAQNKLHHGSKSRQNARARRDIESYSASVGETTVRSAKTEYEAAKKHYASVEAAYKRKAAERDAAKEEFERLQAEYNDCRNAFNAKLAAIKLARETRQHEIVEMANIIIAHQNGQLLAIPIEQDAKVAIHADGTIHLFFGGADNISDGTGHGHAVFSKDGNLIYFRDAHQRCVRSSANRSSAAP